MTDDITIFFINISIYVIFLCFSYFLHKTFFSPLSIFVTFFLLPSNINLITTFNEARLSWLGWSVIWIGTFSFLFGYLTYFVFGWNVAKFRIYDKRFRLNCLANVVNSKRYFEVVFILFILSLCAFLINVDRVYSELGSDFLKFGRSVEIIFGRYTLINYLYFLNLLVIALSVIGVRYSKRNYTFNIFLFFSIFETLFHGNKSTFIIGILIMVYCRLLFDMKVKFQAIVYLVFSVVIIFYVVAIVRLGNDYIYSVDIIDFLMSNIESYIVYNYKNLENIVFLQAVDDNLFPLFFYIFKFVDILNGGLAIANDPVFDSPYFLVNAGYNVITYLGALYLNYGGFAGIIIGSLLIGLFAAYFFVKLYSKPSLFIFVLNVLYFIVLTLSFSAFEFFRAQFLYLLLITYFLSFLFRQLKRLNN
jgi:oligosaccharide repeat unit polymerase